MMRTIFVAALWVALAAVSAAPTARAATENPDVAQLSARLERLDSDPVLGQYAFAQRTLARDAINDLANAGRGEREHALFMAEQRVDLAEASAKADADQAKLDQLQREHDQIMLQASQADAAAARAELARQRLQYEAAVQQAQMLQEQGAQASQQAQQAQAEAEQARKLAAAQTRAAALARKEAMLAEAATKALQAGGSAPSNGGHTGNLQLSSASFSAGSDNLTSAARRRLADFARAHPSQRIVIEPRASSNDRVLAGRRAVAVQAALVAAGAEKVTVWKVAHAASGTQIEVHTQ